MIFCKSREVSRDGDVITFRSDVTIKVDHPDMLPEELRAVLASAITDEHTDLYLSEKIAEIMHDQAELLAKHVQDLMEGEDHDNQNTQEART